MTIEIVTAKCSFTDHLKYKIINKTTCRIPSANPPQLYAH